MRVWPFARSEDACTAFVDDRDLKMFVASADERAALNLDDRPAVVGAGQAEGSRERVATCWNIASCEMRKQSCEERDATGSRSRYA